MVTMLDRLADGTLTAGSSPRHPYRGATVRSTLIKLAAWCLLPGLTVGSSLILLDQQRRETEAEQTTMTAARAMAATLERDLAATVAALKVLATEPSLKSGDFASFQQRAQEALAHQNITNYVLVDTDFKQRVNTLVPWGGALPQVAGPPELRKITATDQTILTDLFIGPVTGRPIIGLGVPVRLDGQMTYSLNVGIEPERITRILQGASLPPTWTGSVLDRQGRVVARTRDAGRYVGQPAVPALREAAQRATHGTLEVPTLEGTVTLAAFQRLEPFGWTVVIGIPAQEVRAGWASSIGILLLSYALLFAVACGVAWRLAHRQFILPVEGLLRRMQGLAHHQDPGPAISRHASAELQTLEAGFEDLRQRLATREAEAAELIQRLSDTLEHMGDGFLALDRHGCIIHLNTQATRLLGQGRPALMGECMRTLFVAQEARPLADACALALSEGRPQSLVVPFLAEHRWLEVDLHPSDWGLSLYFRDVSEAQRLREAQAAKLVAESANQAKTEFLSRMSYELRTPLNAVLGFSQLLRLDTEQLGPKRAAMVGHIETAGQHLLAMISDVLDLSRIESGNLPIQPSPIDARQVAEDTLTMLHHQAEARQVRLSTSMPPEGTLMVQADATRLQQVLLNLLSNGIKYNHAGGEVRLELALDIHDQRLVFGVQDDGPGLRPDQSAHLFEPFNRLGQEFGTEPGTGIGLVISQRIVGLMGGQLQAECHEGLGCRFWFDLPLAETAPASP
jgi:PAS domain S-box-containing protein